MSLNTTPFSALGDSYCTVAQADSHIAAMYAQSAAWTAKSTAEKETFLKSATMDIEKAFSEFGVIHLTLNQALLFPWVGLRFVQSVYPSLIDSATQFRVTALQNQWVPDDFFNNGALFVAQTSGSVAPMFETVAISDFVRSTGAIVHAELSTGLSTTDSLKLCPPFPAWLYKATAEQAAFLMSDSAQYLNDQQAGVVSRSSREGVSVTLKPAQFAWLSQGAFKWIKMGLPATSSGVCRA